MIPRRWIIGGLIVALEPRGAGEIEAAFAAARQGRAGALRVFNSGLFDRQAARLAAAATKARLPAMYGLRSYAEAGGLVINLKAAQALGIAIPPSLLARADEVIR